MSPSSGSKAIPTLRMFRKDLGNTTADLLADQGASKHPQGLEALGRTYAFRRHIYLKVPKQIHMHIAKVFAKFQELEKDTSKLVSALGQGKPGVVPSLPPQAMAMIVSLDILNHVGLSLG